MPLGTNYDWSGMMGGYGDALSQLYRRRQPDFTDFLRNLAPHLGNFLQRRKLEQMMQQMRMGNVLGAGEGMVLPQDINMLGQAAPESMPWEKLASLVGEEPSPFPAGPMSVSKEAQRDLPPLFARDPYNEMTRQLDLQYKIGRLQPEQKEPKEWQVEREEFKKGYKLLHPEATEEDISKAWYQQQYGVKAKEPSERIKKRKDKLKWQEIKTKIKEKGQASLRPAEWAKWKELNAEFGGAPEERIAKKYENYVAAVVKANQKAASEGSAFVITPMPQEEFEAHFGEKADPKMEAHEAYNRMKRWGFDKKKMLERYNKNMASLIADGVDTAYLLELIEGGEPEESNWLKSLFGL